jgi:catechol 2,3-dioxygenase-like lactoylglutathione lyase family enzyme
MTVKSTSTYPRTINHIGLAVPDLDAAIEWYGSVLGFELFAGPFDLTSDNQQFGALINEVLPGVTSFRLAHLATGNGVGLELFEFIDPPAQLDARAKIPPRTGFFHVCVTDHDPAALAARIVDRGGRQRTQVWTTTSGEPYAFVYTEDPWKNLIEIYSHDYQRTYANFA